MLTVLELRIQATMSSEGELCGVSRSGAAFDARLAMPFLVYGADRVSLVRICADGIQTICRGAT